MKLFNLSIVALLALLLSACGDDDNAEPPADLTSIDSRVSFKQQWSLRGHGGTGRQYLFLEPLLLDDKLVTVDRDGAVKVLDLEHGDVLQTLDLDTTISAGVGGNADLWLLATRDAQVIALDADKLSVKWSSRVPSEVLARPLIFGNKVIVRTVDGQIISLNVADGSMQWSYQQVLPALTLRGNSIPIATRDHVYVGLDSGRLAALSTDKGDVIWDIALAEAEGRSEIQRLIDIDGNAELYGRVLYAASYQGRVIALDVEHGQLLWARPFSSYSGVTVDDKTLYSSDDRSHVWAMERFNGATLWKQDKLTAREVTRPVIIGDYVVVGDYAGYLHLMSRFDGQFVGRVQVGEHDFDNPAVDSGILVPPLVYADHLIVITRDGSLYNYQLRPVVAEQDE